MQQPLSKQHQKGAEKLSDVKMKKQILIVLVTKVIKKVKNSFAYVTINNSNIHEKDISVLIGYEQSNFKVTQYRKKVIQ